MDYQLLNTKSLPPQVAAFFEEELKMMRVTAFPPRSWPGIDPLLSHLIDKGELAIIDSWEPNAFASYLGSGHYFIGINAGLICAITDAVFFAFECPAVANEFFISPRPIKLRQPPNLLFLDYEFIPKLPKNARFSDVVCTITEHEERRRLAVHIIHFALAWVCLHERAHILQGHLDLANQATNTDSFLEYHELAHSTSSVLRESMLLRQTLELHADALAIAELCKRNTQPSIWETYTVDLLQTPAAVYRFSVFAAGIVMQILKKLETHFGFGEYHPPTGVRFMSMFNESTHEHPDAVDEIGYGLRECSVLPDEFPHILPPFEFFTETDHWDPSSSERNINQLDELIKILRTIRPELNLAIDRLRRKLERYGDI